MERIKDVFTDFKISSPRGPNLAGCLETAAELGYKRVAIDVQVQVTHRTTPLPPVRELDEQIAAVAIPKGLEVLKRLTVILDDPNILHSVQGSSVLDQYDITALHCTNDKVFQVAVTSLTTDIISLEWGERLGYALRRTQISQIIGRGIVFELCYTPAIKDSSQRCHIISNALHLASISKGKGIIISSGAHEGIELRGPRDVINLCHIFDMKTEQCKATIMKNCTQVMSHAKQRREIVKGAVSCSVLIKDDMKRKREEEGDEHNLTIKRTCI